MSEVPGSVNKYPNRGRGSRPRGRYSFRPYYRRGFNQCQPREKPVTVHIPDQSKSNNDVTIQTDSSSATITVGPVDKEATLFLNKNEKNYPGWQLYFPSEKYDESSMLFRKIKAFEKHYKHNSDFYNVLKIRQQFWFVLPLQFLLRDERFQQSYSNFMQDLTQNPEQTLKCAAISMYKLTANLSISSLTNSIENERQAADNQLQLIQPRIQGFSPIINLRTVKANNYDRLIAFRGTVIRTGAAEVQCTWLTFRCSMCSKEQAVHQGSGIMTQPTSCQGGCRARSNFIPLLSSPFTRTVAYQKVKIQDTALGITHECGRIPRTIEVELTEDLVDSVCPGDDVIVTGIMKVRPQEDIQRKPQASLYKMYVQAVAISSNKNMKSNRRTEFTEKDIELIKTISEEPCPFRLLVHSLCPEIFGHEFIKAGLLLGLFGGSAIDTRRSEIHVLVVGDPGLGKSQMLQACANILPRGIFVSGNSSTSTGLTVSVRYERGCNGGGTLEAGALVLSDQGICCIDEFDKMSANHNALLEVMEQQTVSVAKAGILCSLPARTSILAAANPSGGHYDRAKTIPENLKINAALLSRFDLIFILLDKPNENFDKQLTAHIQAINAGDKKPLSGSSFIKNKSINVNSTADDSGEYQRLSDRLKLLADENLDLLPPVLMQKYIVYARKNINPKLTPEAAQVLKEFYLELRQLQFGYDSLPVTIRQLEALIRLTQARARLELSKEANVKHALDIVSLFRYSMADVINFEDGNISLQMPQSRNSSSQSTSTQAKKFLQIIKQRSIVQKKTIYDLDELKVIMNMGSFSADFSSLIDALNMQGYLLKKGKSLYKILID